MMGGRMLGGSWRSAPATFSRTSCAALSISRSRTNLQVMRALPSVAVELSSSRPLIVLTASSSGRMTCVVTSSLVAPGSLMLIVTVAGSALGKRSTPRSRNEKTPRTTRKLMTMTANTGRFTQISDNDIAGSRALRDDVHQGTVAQLHSLWGQGDFLTLLESFHHFDVGIDAFPDADLPLGELVGIDGIGLVDAVRIVERSLWNKESLVNPVRRDPG